MFFNTQIKPQEYFCSDLLFCWSIRILTGKEHLGKDCKHVLGFHGEGNNDEPIVRQSEDIPYHSQKALIGFK